MQPQNSKTDRIWRLIDILNWGETYFRDKNFDNPRTEIELLLQHLIGCKKIDLYLQFEKIVKPKELITLRSWVKRRINREPIQYITRSSEFYGRKFIVDQNVLIPRPETEILIDVSVEILSKKNSPTIIDIGTGSGCIGITLALEIPSSNIIAIDISDSALSIAKKNADMYSIRNIEFLRLDILNQDIIHIADMLISNPPYISKEEIPDLMEDVKDFEPMIALTDKSDGLDFYRKFSDIMPHVIKKNGTVILEVGRGSHSDRVKEIFCKSGYNNIDIVKDLNKDKRVFIISNS
ncbi:MAG: peptide chain release factor N(5)-glutamine methyltransferase [Candidatus Neomarinimicrobiota bacterium]|nr:peptide chain release factor N(5)-glutamine methyltransferase [Candidatus Neomarinimicrobiota bacterium]